MKTFCVIGAGPAGLAVIKRLRGAGISVECHESQSDLGGCWNIASPHSRIFASTHLISSKRLTEYPDFRMPKEYPPYPSHQQAFQYLQAYASHFGLRESIRFSSRVLSAKPNDCGWQISIEGQTEPIDYHGLIVASGHHWDPLVPEWPGEFTGCRLHAAQYKEPSPFRDQRVLVVGGGNSGCDIAVDLVGVARSVHLSLRRGYHFLPKFLLGAPIDRCGESLENWWLPKFVKRRIAEYLIHVSVGSPTRYGLPKPDHRLFQTHPIVNSELLLHLGHGRIQVMPDVACLAQGRVRFADEQELPFDSIITATGYRVCFPFLDRSLVDSILSSDTGPPHLFLNVFPPSHENLYFAGLIQPNGGIWALADLQAQLIARSIKESRGRFATAIARGRQRPGKFSGMDGLACIDSPRHALEVDYLHYRRTLRKLMAL